ncbi:DUF86 domain-containing protein [Candidatus Pacearchaeota archaeon]|nr:DUF86 domain-containing protein [Candidatus Pacearchaeota archaeon]
MNRIKDKIDEARKYLNELSEIIPSDFEQYKSEFKTKAACERYFEKIIGSVVDLAFLVIKEHKLKIPEEDKQAFDILNGADIIPNELKERLKDAKGMRNIIAHEYGEIDNKMVFESLKEQLIPDIEEFIGQIKKFLRK